MTSVVFSSFTDSVISRSPWNSEGSFALVHVNICMAVHSSGEVLLGHGCTHSVNSEQLYKAKRKKKRGWMETCLLLWAVQRDAGSQLREI